MAYIGRTRSSSKLLSTVDDGGRNKKRRKLQIYEKGGNIVSHLFNILVFLPADILYNVMRYVCREWSKIIHDPVFINEHLLLSNLRILLKISRYEEYLYSVEMWKSDVRITYDKGPLFRIMPLATCNGLLLLHERPSKLLLVRNPITRQELAIPRIFLRFFAGMAYASSSRVFKVVNVSHDKEDFAFAIISVGIDEAWRLLDTKSLSPLAQKLLLCDRPFSAGGYPHWAPNGFSSILTLDAETEAFQLRPLPEGCDDRRIHYFVMGNSFSFMNRCSKFLWEVWVLVEKGIGGWMKLDNIDLRGRKDMLERRFCPHEYNIFPVGWLKSREVMLLGVTSPSKTFVWYVETYDALENCNGL